MAAPELQESTGYQIAMVALSIFALAGVGAQSTLHLQPETERVLQLADNVVCGMFLLDFALSLARARDRLRYLRTWGWLDLLSSIPTIALARWSRVARIVRGLRVLRALRATKVVGAALNRVRAKSALVAAALVAFLCVVFASIAVLQFESGPEANILTADDAVWWAFATITTVGYGDLFPVTTEGRIVAGLLMAVGVGLVGTFSGFFAAWLMGSTSQASDTALSELRAEIASLRGAIETLAQRHSRAVDRPGGTFDSRADPDDPPQPGSLEP